MVSLKTKNLDQSSNKIIQEQIFKIVSNTFFIECKTPLKLSRLIINDFSSCFYVENNEKGVYVKIPKQDIIKSSLTDLSLEDKILAKNEYDSLLFFNSNWIDREIQFVNVLGYNSNYNAIFTEKVNGKDFWKLVKNADFKKKVGFDFNSKKVCSLLNKIGWAHNLHQKNNIEEEKLFNWNQYIEKIHVLKNELGSSIEKSLSYEVEKVIELTRNLEIQSFTTKTLKGLDIRNIIYQKNGKITILDPGKLKTDFRQVDIARFLVTLKIIYWGSLRFFWGLVPSEDFEYSFLQSYKPNLENDLILKFIIIKELFRHWVTAMRVLSLKKWNIHLKDFMKKKYISPFYTTQLNKVINDFKKSMH